MEMEGGKGEVILWLGFFRVMEGERGGEVGTGGKARKGEQKGRINEKRSRKGGFCSLVNA